MDNTIYKIKDNFNSTLFAYKLNITSFTSSLCLIFENNLPNMNKSKANWSICTVKYKTDYILYKHWFLTLQSEKELLRPKEGLNSSSGGKR